jgi:hypothetical protein
MASSHSPSPGLHINIKAPRLPAIRNERGRFQVAKADMEAQNRQLAFAVQAQVGALIAGRILRKGVSTNRLVKVTMEPWNAVYNDTYAGVGNQRRLDQSIAKYWRTIEEGSAKTWTKRSFLSLELQGLWGMNIASWRSGPSGDWVALGRGRARGDARQEMYHPFRRGKGSTLPIFHPRRQIQPMNAYRDAKRNPEWDARAVEISRRFLEKVADMRVRPSGGPG